MGKTYVIGHKNPDTDSVCGAISLSYLKNAMGYDTEPRILGEINSETDYALSYFNIPVPKVLEDVKVKIKDIRYHKDYYINENKSIYETYNFMNEYNITGIPLVDNNKKFVGYVSLKEIAKSMISLHNSYLNTIFDNIVNTLNSKYFYKITDVIVGNIVSATLEDNTFIEKIKLDSNSILIVGDRKKIINYAIDSKIQLLILVGNVKLDEDELIRIRNNNINLIYTPYTSFEVSKFLELSNSINTIKRSENSVCLNSEDYLSDFIEVANRTKHTNYPIINTRGECFGMLRLIDTNEYNKRKLILVDHNSLKQSVDGIEEAEILEIIDHHNIADTTKIPINYRILPVGSVNTIIYYLYKENDIEIPLEIAGLMISGIISDTLLLNSPTTTYQDRYVLMELSKRLGIDYNKYGMNLLKSGMNYNDMSIEDIIYNDYKVFTVKDNKFSIGQVLTVDFNDFIVIKEDIIKSLNEISIKNGFKVTALFITNIINKESMIFYSEESKMIIKDAFDLDSVYEGIILDGILSRKKQIVPVFMDVFERM